MYHSESGINGAKLRHNMPLIKTLQAAATTLNSIKIRVDYTQPKGERVRVRCQANTSFGLRLIPSKTHPQIGRDSLNAQNVAPEAR